jgi:hypothetical protein
MKTQPISRRALAAGLALAPVAGLPALAGANSAAPISDALAQAIERHRAALVAFDTCGDNDAEIDATGATERAARWELATLPCESLEDFFGKLRYLLEEECGVCDGIDFFENYGSVVVEVDAHFNPANYIEEEA